MQREQLKVGGYLDTEEKVLEFYRALNGNRQHDTEVGKAYGLNRHQIDTLRLIFNKVEYHTTYITEETKDKVVDLYQSGVSLKIIQKEIGCSASQVYYILNDRVERNRHEFWSPIKEKRLVYLREEKKLTWREIAANLGKSLNACHEKYKIIKRKRAKNVR